MTSTKAVVCVKLSDQVCKELKEGNKLYYKISCKDTSIVIGNKTKPSKEFPITYTKKEKISAFAFYTDKSCQEIVTIATYGSTIYARVLTRNLTGKSLEIFIYRKTPGFFYGANNIELSKSESKVDGEGIAIFEIKISNDWKNKGNDSYVLAVTEKGDPFYKEKGLSNWETNDTAQNEFTIGKDLLFMRFIDEPISDNDGKVLTKIGKAKSQNSKVGKCPNCEKKITKKQLEKIFWYEKTITKGGKSVKEKIYPSDADLQIAVDIFNKYMIELGLNSCRNKAFFFAIAAVETGYKLQIKDGESFKYYWKDIIKTFEAFTTEEGYEKAKEWGREVNEKKDNPLKYKQVTSENEKKIANYAYSASCKTGKQLENVNANDGWDYRGRGIIQLTGRGGYRIYIC